MKQFKTAPTRRQWLALTAAASAAFSVGVQAQSTWPTKPVTLVVPFPAGGGTDAFARPFSAQFSKQSGKTLVIDNRGGAGGNLGASVAAKAAPDGYTLFMGAVHHSIAPAMYPKLDYDLERDFVPIAMVASVPHVLVVNPKNVPGDFKAFLQMVRNNPGKFNYGSAGGGTSHHLAGELLASMGKVDLLHVPYRGDAGSITALLAGDVPFIIAPPTAVLANIKAGKLKAIAATGPQRWAGLPDVPTVAEQGVAGYDVRSWAGLMAPAGTPKPVIDKLNAETLKAIQLPHVKARLEEMGGDVRGSTPDEMKNMVAFETQKWIQVVNNAKIPKQ